MATPYLCEIRIFSFNYPPKGWAQCNGQLLAISQNQALFSLLGTTFGGNGVQTFGLPNLQGRVPMHFNATYALGQASGEANHTLTINEMPSHNHTPVGSTLALNAGTAANNFWAAQVPSNPYAASGAVPMAATALQNNPGGQAHNNMAPYLTVNICIALQGIFPSRN